MPAIGITGGVATGKSSFTRALFGKIAGKVFDADQCVHRLLAADVAVIEQVKRAFGPQVISSDGGIDRVSVRAIVFEDEVKRGQLEAILHPRVRDEWVSEARAAKASDEIFFADIPLLYETAAEGECDKVLVIACSPEVQRRRMAENRSLASALIERMIKSQLDLTVKVSRADHVVWNDGLPAALDEQARLFADYLRDFYG